MPIRRFAFALLAAVSLTAAAGAQPAGDPKCPPPRPRFDMVTPEQRLIMQADFKAQADAGADIEVLRQMRRDKLKAMTPEQREAYLAGLTKRWNALSPAEQAKLKADSEAWRAAHPRPPRNPDCPPPQ